jgi:hypothetical protein
LADDKFLIPLDLPVAHFLFILRKRLQLQFKPEVAIFVFVKREGMKKHEMPLPTNTFETVFAEFGFEDGHLPLYYSTENTFG